MDKSTNWRGSINLRLYWDLRSNGMDATKALYYARRLHHD